jgi:gas vesicle protein
MPDRSKDGGFLIGFVIGSVIGLSVGFLYAPRPGEETREILGERVGAAREKATEIAQKIKGNLPK